jgi:hypothetical protein
MLFVTLYHFEQKCALHAYNFIEENWQSFEKPNIKGLKSLQEIEISSTNRILT